MDANAPYLRATLTDLDPILRREVFDAFPDNPGDPTASGVKNLSGSLQSVLATSIPHQMARQRYDIRTRNGLWRRRVWKPINVPVLDDNGEIEAIVHHVEDVTRVAVGARTTVDGL